MIIHSDLMLNGILRIEKYDDRIVLTNPGLLKLPIEQIYQGGESKARNQRMQNMFCMKPMQKNCTNLVRNYKNTTFAIIENQMNDE